PFLGENIHDSLSDMTRGAYQDWMFLRPANGDHPARLCWNIECELATERINRCIIPEIKRVISCSRIQTSSAGLAGQRLITAFPIKQPKHVTPHNTSGVGNQPNPRHDGIEVIYGPSDCSVSGHRSLQHLQPLWRQAWNPIAV